MRFRLRWISQSSNPPLFCRPLKLKSIILFSCLFAVFAWVSHMPYARNLDLAIMQAFQSSESPGLNQVFVPFVILGSSQVSASFFLLLSFWFYNKKDFRKAYWVLTALLVVTGVEVACKHTFSIIAPGPEFRGNFPVKWNSISIKTQSCFPSGHSLRTALLSVFVMNWVEPIRRQPLWRFALALFPLATGFAMVYYGFHWLSDVVAGFWLALLAFAVSRQFSTSS